MKIECVLKRDGGTRAELGGLLYHFEPLADGAHVAEVANEGHIDRLLAIPEAYKVYHGKLAPQGAPQHNGLQTPAPAPAPAAASASVALSGSELHPPQFEIGGKVFTQRDVVQKAFEASGLTSDDWNELGEDERAAKIDIVLDELADAAEAAGQQRGEPPEVDMAEVRAQLAAQYEAKFGKKPHHKKSVEAIKAELEA